MSMGKGKVHSQPGKGYKVVQYGAHCAYCNKKMGKGTVGVVESSSRGSYPFFYWHPSCYKKSGR